MHIYLIKLINHADSFICQYQCSGLQRPLLCHRTPLDVGREPHGRGTLPRCENGARGDLLDVLEKLRLCCPWISTEEDIDITTDLVFLAYEVTYICTVDQWILVYTTRWSMNTPGSSNSCDTEERLLIPSS